MLWAAVLLVLSFIVGRFFCGYVCPLGTLIDLSDFLVHGKKHKKESADPKKNRRVKYYILAGVVAASLLGANLLAFFSPLSIAPRVFSLSLFPPLVWLADGILDLLRPAFTGLGFDSLAQVNFHRYFFSSGITILAIFAAIIVANFWRKRFWCRYVCPTGALISLFSRFGIVKRRVNGALCSDCKLCSAACDMRAVDADPRNTVLSECVLCGDCVTACKKGAVSIGFGSLGFGQGQPRS